MLGKNAVSSFFDKSKKGKTQNEEEVCNEKETFHYVHWDFSIAALIGFWATKHHDQGSCDR